MIACWGEGKGEREERERNMQREKHRTPVKSCIDGGAFSLGFRAQIDRLRGTGIGTTGQIQLNQTDACVG